MKGNENHNDADPKVVTVKIATPSTYTVTVTNDGHGTGAANPASGVTGTEVALTNTPAEGYQFKEWQVISGGVTVVDNKFTIGTANVEVKAIFEETAEPVKSTFYFRKVWEGSTEKSIDFTLYSADGKVVHQSFTKTPGTAKEWSYYAVFTGAGSCYIIEKPIPGYITRYVNVGEYAGITDRCCNGGTIINKRIPKTGDETPLLLWAGMLLTGAAGLTVALTIRKRKKAHK